MKMNWWAVIECGISGFISILFGAGLIAVCLVFGLPKAFGIDVYFMVKPFIVVWLAVSLVGTVYFLHWEWDVLREEPARMPTSPVPYNQNLHQELALRLARMEQIKVTAYQQMGAVRQINETVIAEVADALRAVERIRNQFGGYLPPEAASRLRELTWAATAAMDAIANAASERIRRM